VRRSLTWLLLAMVTIGVAACGVDGVAPQGAGTAGTISLSLTTVPTVRSVTVSPGTATFGVCDGGRAREDTQSTVSKLGFPDGQCSVGLLSPGIYPITITNTGIASYVYVSGTSANPVNPAEDGDQWSLCNIGDHPAVACTHRNNTLPGTDQYLLQNFSPFGESPSGISDTPVCDPEFGPAGRCWAVEGASQTEGLELTGPFFSIDGSAKWTMTVTWTPVPSQG
jgi:hypothetical protein